MKYIRVYKMYIKMQIKSWYSQTIKSVIPIPKIKKKGNIYKYNLC